MAAFIWRQWWVVALLLFVPAPPQVQCRDVTHEDIREAIMSLLYTLRESQDKLERHEYREKALGDQLKKALATLDKKQRTLEPVKGMISRLDDRLSNVETILLQKEEREKASQKKTAEALESIQKSLQALAGAGDNLTAQQPLGAKVDALKGEVEQLKNKLDKESLRAMCLEAGSTANPLEKHLTEAEKLLTKYELKLNEYNGNGTKVQTDFVPLSDVVMADDAWHSKMTEVMERQEQDIKKIQRLLSDAEGLWKELPRASDLRDHTNQTLAAIQTAKENLKENDDSSVSKMGLKLREMSDRLVRTNEDIQRSLTQGNTMSERAYNDITKSYDSLRNEVQALSKNENVMIQTADNVMATKKRIEYGVHQILIEVGDLVKAQTSTLSDSIKNRFDLIEKSILENQSGALTNLSSKIESEMSQVWRQIGIMYQQLTASKVSLDKLTEQTEQYVNGSATVMASMKDKVGMITSRMSEVDENLNYLLGRLSLVTQEFAAVKVGLGDALDQVKTSFHTVKGDIDDAGPGPHKISGAEPES